MADALWAVGAYDHIFGSCASDCGAVLVQHTLGLWYSRLDKYYI